MGGREGCISVQFQHTLISAEGTYIISSSHWHSISLLVCVYFLQHVSCMLQCFLHTVVQYVRMSLHIVIQ